MPNAARPSLAAVIFDWGGVFVQRPPGSARRALERRLGLPAGGLGAFFNEDDWLLHSTGQQTEAEFWERVCAGFPVAPDQSLARAVWTHLFVGPPVRPQLVELAAALRGRVRVGLLSNAGPVLRHVAAGQLPLFDDVVISAEVGCRKPEPEIYRLALRRLGAEPEETLFVDDTERNLLAARELGIRGHRFRTPGRLKEALEAEGLLGDTGLLPLEGSRVAAR